MERGQSSTEYLVLFAISLIILSVIILAYIDIPAAKNTSEQVLDNKYDALQEVGLVDYIYAKEGIHLNIANNALQKVTISNIDIDGTNQSITGLPITISPKSSQLVTWYTENIPESSYTDTITIHYCVGSCLISNAVTYSKSGERRDAYLTAAIDPSETLSDYLTLYLPFDEDYDDHSSYGHNVTVLETPKLVPGTFGKRLWFNTTELQFRVQDIGTSLDITDKTNHTIVARVQTDAGSVFTLFNKNYSDSTQYTAMIYSFIHPFEWGLFIKDDGPSATCNYVVQNASVLPDITSEFMVTMTLEHSGIVKQYINETLRGQLSHTSCASSQIQYTNVTQGDVFLFDQNNAQNTYVDEYMIFNKSLTVGEVRSLYQRGAQN